LPAIHTYGKTERLKSRKRIEAIFKTGKRVPAHPLMFIYRLHDDNPESLLQAGVGVRSKQFRKAVDRNRIKRILRESYRLQKDALRQQVHDGRKSLDVFIIYTGQEMPVYADIFTKAGEALRKIMERYGEEQ
jgi:ribonuclease P protein component